MTANVTRLVEASFYSRCPPEERPTFLHDNNRVDATVNKNAQDAAYPPSACADALGTKYDRSFVRALYTVYWARWWIAGALRLITELLKATSPLVTKALLSWLSTSYTWHNAGESTRTSGQVMHFRCAFPNTGVNRVVSRLSNQRVSDMA